MYQVVAKADFGQGEKRINELEKKTKKMTKSGKQKKD